MIDAIVMRLIESINPSIRASVASHPAEALQVHFGLTVQAEPQLGLQRESGGACDGVSFLRDSVVLYAPSIWSRRENFTLTHELGHWLVSHDADAVDWLSDQNDPDRMLELLCDRIAQKLLLPDDLVDSILDGKPVRAVLIRELYDASAASEPVCAIALAARLPGHGAVLITDLDVNTVSYASIRTGNDDSWPAVYPWPGTAVPPGHPLRTLRPGSTMARKSFWRAPWGTEQPYYLDAVADNRRVYAVLSAWDIWEAERFHSDAPFQVDQRPQREILCCGQTVTVRAWPCADCSEPHCPKCGLCRCDRQLKAQKQCERCYIIYPAHLVVAGRCPDCS